jgi:hypothetical protein
LCQKVDGNAFVEDQLIRFCRPKQHLKQVRDLFDRGDEYNTDMKPHDGKVKHFAAVAL